MPELQAALAQAAQWLAQADGLIIAAGAGMGVDSGLPDFRGDAGFWRAYPALGEAGIRFEAIANPRAFALDPALAWGFYGHRLALYRRTVPHAGFGCLQAWAAAMPQGAFVFTSNVDGQFQRAGFSAARVLECHGSIHHLQCTRPCSRRIWTADTLALDVDEARCRCRSPLPLCPDCGALARPHILMFGDAAWVDEPGQAQEAAYGRWRRQLQTPVVVELGAGTAVPSVRWFAERQGAPLIRINPREAQLPPGVTGVGVPLGVLAGLQALSAALAEYAG